MTNSETKIALIEALYNRGEFIKRSGDEYIVKCPLCGDNSKPNNGHFYMKINPEDNYNIPYFCFRCEERGKVNSDILEALGIDDINLKSMMVTLNKTSDRMDSKHLYDNEKRFNSFDFKLPKVRKYGYKIEYINNRIGKRLTEKDLDTIKAITSLKEFCDINEITDYPYNTRALNIIEKYYVGFLSFGSSHILFRNVTEKDFGLPNWLKYSITKKSAESMCFYSLATDIDPMSTEKLIVNISEGIMDIISVGYNFNGIANNTINIAVTGKYYRQILLFLLDLGIVGSNVELNIYADNDIAFNKKAKNPTTPDYFRKTLSRYRELYGSVRLHYNTIAKDYGYPKEMIKEKIIKL